MTRVVDAIYCDGVLKPVETLELPEHQRVRLTIETVDGQAADKREAARQLLVERLKQSSLSYGQRMPSREELHERR